MKRLIRICLFTVSFLVCSACKDNISFPVNEAEKAKTKDVEDVVEEEEETVPDSISLSIEAIYPLNSNWMQYIKRDDFTGDAADAHLNWYVQDDVACDGTETGSHSSCIHGGEKRRVLLTGLSTCVDITAEDELDVFNWTCIVLSGQAYVVMQGLKNEKGLKDLVTSSGDAWKGNRVIVTKEDYTFGGTDSETWWSNPVTALPVNDTTVITSLTSGTVYTVASDQTTRGVNTDGIDSLGIVVLDGAKLTKSSSGTEDILILNNSNFHYIEGHFDGFNIARSVMTIESVNHSQILNVNLENPGNWDCLYTATSNHNLYKNIRCVMTEQGALIESNAGFSFKGASYNIFNKINISNIDGSFDGLSCWDSSCSDNVFTTIIIGSHSAFNADLAPFNGLTATHITSINSAKTRTFDFEDSDNITLAQTLILNPNPTSPLHFSGANTDANNQFSNLVIDRIDTTTDEDIDLNNSEPFTFFHNLILDLAGECRATGVSPGLNGTCVPQAPSTATLTTGVSSHTAIIGKATSDDETNAEPSSNELYANISDWVHFDSIFRFWSKDGSAFPNDDNRGACRGADSCAIWDVRLKNTDTTIYNRSGDGNNPNDSFLAGTNCPGAVHGNTTLTDGQGSPNTFLVNALEILSDSLGDDDGLCESNEACLYSPHFGAYQGEGDYRSNGTCNFVDGTVSGVTMYAYPQLGID